MTPTKQRIAVIGSGIAGLAAAYFLRRRHHVVLYEEADHLGGHANTVDVQLDGLSCGVDTGFLVHNDRTYPNFVALLDELGVASLASDMSFGVSLDQGAFEWAGTDLDTVFAQRRHLFSPAFLGMLRDMLHLHRHADRFLAHSSQGDLNLGQLLAQNNYGAKFRDAYLLPMAAAIWSSSPGDILQFPAATFLRFCRNHALLQLRDRPQWRTVEGGSRHYVEKIAASLPDCRLSTPVFAVLRHSDSVEVFSTDGPELFNAVVMATHAPTTLALLAAPSEQERTLLGAVRDQSNQAYLHTDLQLMPKRRKVWSAWNYLGGAGIDGRRAVCVSYWLNRLQSLPFPTPLMVTLNPHQAPAPAQTLAQFQYEHPIMDRAAIRAQEQLPGLQGVRNTWYAGAWTGYGFHEDGLKSALRIARAFGVAPDWAVLP